MADKGEQSESNQDEGFGTVRGRLLQNDELIVELSNKEEKPKTNTNSDK